MKRVVAACAAMAIVHAIVAWWTPVQGDAWLHWIWAGRHPDASIGTWLVTHATSADAFGYLLARCHLAHVILSPLVSIALVVGLFTVALRRLPRDGDLLGLGLTSALIWIAQPHAGVVWFYTPSVAMHVYGAAAAVWVLAPFRCGWTVPRSLWPLLVVLGYLAGTSTRAIGLLALVLMLMMLRGRRERWTWFALGGLVAGTLVGYALPPYLEVGKVLRRGVDPNGFVLTLPIEEIGKAVALVCVLALVEAGRRVAMLRPLADDARPSGREAFACLVAYLVTSVWCILGPKYYEATLLPATCLLVVGALPWLLWFATARGYRLALAGFTVAVHAVAWSLALVSYHGIGAEGAARQDALDRTPSGEVATLPTYSQILPTFFFFGEDLANPRMRQLVAVEALGLRDIELEPSFRRLEENPQIEVALESDATPAELAAARVPVRWGTVPSVAREQFEQFLRRLPRKVAAKLVVKNLAFPQLATRPLLLAWADAHEIVAPRSAVSSLDEENQYTVKLYTGLKMFDEAWFVQNGVATKTPYRNGSPRIRPTTPTLAAVVVCNSSVCLLEDAFVPRF